MKTSNTSTCNKLLIIKQFKYIVFVAFSQLSNLRNDFSFDVVN